ncbi:MAG: hypothetical protein Q8O56_14730 [Solirubrobacteraceae bacterium]|nr:hypothetical protein [Solirubrobacteraceae bacterium]
MNRRVLSRRIARVCVICCAALAIPAGAAHAQSETLRGSVGGFTSPARGALQLVISASDAGPGLASATATVDGVLAGHVRLGAESCGDPSAPDPPAAGACPAAVTGVPLIVDLQPFAIGRHHLQVRIADAVGNAALIFDAPLDVAGSPPIRTPSVSLQVGDGTAPVAGQPTPTPARGAEPSCAAPRLSMTLDQRPLRVTRAGVPVLRHGARYRFRGRLTCEVRAGRRSAPTGVVVQTVHRLGPGGRFVVGKAGIVTRRTGQLTLIDSYRSSRTLEFRHASADGTTSRVRIAVIVAKAAPRTKARTRR